MLCIWSIGSWTKLNVYNIDFIEMETSLTSLSEPSSEAFAQKVGVELNRAERYRVFVSLTVIDLEPATAVAGEKASEILQDIMSRVKDAVRACDYVELLDDHSLAVLLPETPRQGAEVAARRLADLANYLPDDVQQLSRRIRQSLRRTCRHACVLRSFFNHAKLQL